MPLYEIVLCFPERDEVRLTDQPLVVGETVEIAGHEWTVVFEREAKDVRVAARFLCELAKEQRFADEDSDTAKPS